MAGFGALAQFELDHLDLTGCRSLGELVGTEFATIKMGWSCSFLADLPPQLVLDHRAAPQQSTDASAPAVLRAHRGIVQDVGKCDS
jgi:hypothetical protein